MILLGVLAHQMNSVMILTYALTMFVIPQQRNVYLLKTTKTYVKMGCIAARVMYAMKEDV